MKVRRKADVKFIEARANEVFGLPMTQITKMKREVGGLGLDSTWWSHVKKGDFEITIENAEVLAESLGCKVDDLYVKSKKKTDPEAKEEKPQTIVTIDETLYKWMKAISEVVDSNNQMLYKLTKDLYPDK